MSFEAQQGYGQVRRETASPRSIEFQILTQIASALESADPSTPEGYKQLADAVHRNNELWTIFATDVSSTDNQCAPALKAEILRLAQFQIKHGLGVLRGEAGATPLVEVNRTVAQGLRPAAQAA